ncbi:amino acid--[acyl-carrier-protein] ligase [Burkholderia sp. WAC0059]|uniref:amino acid--[acyl-carrier-protein] ligase n=1 Tax=Burkholderia sp. WAC0059 TaxID=2066022 RepID=UPI000C7EBC50|nr:amino acid--[acyl-carrier-protein] ligase [Burkholderia sp. WAC0059]PLZ03562.1 amino acid--[acyl-carrier-protein] ligase [Burkholderia sp. WAC0059]
MNATTERAAPEAARAAPLADLRARMIEAGLLVETGEDGLYGRSQTFEDVIDRLNDAVSALGADQHAEVLRFPPAMTRRDFEHSEYLKSFPELAGTIHAFQGNEAQHRRLLTALDEALAADAGARDDAWMDQQQPTRLVLVPAACYPVYPLMARRGPLPAGGATFDVLSYCFRHEPSLDPCRMQLFRMREYVQAGSPGQVMAFRQQWIRRGALLATLLGLPFAIDLANDPFFGRGGKIVADSQRAQQLKFELLVEIVTPGPPTACLSFNYHLDHFGALWRIACEDGSIAHTGCVGFGLERLALALFRHHGLDPDAWPAGVRDLLWGSPQAMREKIAAGLAEPA